MPMTSTKRDYAQRAYLPPTRPRKVTRAQSPQAAARLGRQLPFPLTPASHTCSGNICGRNVGFVAAYMSDINHHSWSELLLLAAAWHRSGTARAADFCRNHLLGEGGGWTALRPSLLTPYPRAVGHRPGTVPPNAIQISLGKFAATAQPCHSCAFSMAMERHHSCTVDTNPKWVTSLGFNFWSLGFMPLRIGPYYVGSIYID